jgi:membrane-associated phospholipid phosphatase
MSTASRLLFLRRLITGESDSASTGVSRRHFLTTTGGAVVAGAFAPAIAAAAQENGHAADTAQPEKPSQKPDRKAQAHNIRISAADYERKQPHGEHESNGDDARYENLWASYTKALPHDELGHVTSAAYVAYRGAMSSGDPDEMERIPLGGFMKLANPHAALAFDLMGPDAGHLVCAAPPRMDSEERAAELVELYWQALLRDVPFTEWASNDLVTRACAELTKLRTFSGPRRGGAVTPETIFRGGSRGGLTGPYISQFLIRDIPFGATKIPQRYRVAAPKKEYLTAFDEWQAMQNGGLAPSTAFVDGLSHMITPRILTEYVHRDFTYQAFLSAALMLLKTSAPLDGAIPYQYSINQGGFVTFGGPDVLHYVATVANCSLKPAWYQKWIVHRTARPEEIGARLHCMLDKKGAYPIHASVLHSDAVAETKKRYATALLPQAYPEGCPTHPSFPAGHAVIAGACTTVLKAWFSENWVLPTGSLPNAQGTALVPYGGPDLTVGGELDKLAENIAIGRNFAGVHWRSDGLAGLRLGETFAIQFLREMKMTSRELFNGFTLTTFDGAQITV